jgi:hypothetical protein
MSPTLTTKLFEREARPWSLANHITKSICLLAGREASAALCIALGRHTGASVAHETTYDEPFTYWDWYGVEPDDTYAREWKKQRIWEHQRGFVVDGAPPYGYPTSRERWWRFKEDVEVHQEKRLWVKSIAVAHWMDIDELYWCVHAFMGSCKYIAGSADVNDLGSPTPYPILKDWT